jgi:hypothetical protein
LKQEAVNVVIVLKIDKVLILRFRDRRRRESKVVLGKVHLASLGSGEQLLFGVDVDEARGSKQQRWNAQRQRGEGRE